MRDKLRDIIGSGKYNHIRIATGYWDLPGTALVYDQLKTFLEGGGRLDIMIGQEPQLRSYQLQAPEPDQQQFPDFYLQRDINRLTDDYRPVAELIQQFCNVRKYEHLVADNRFKECGDEPEETQEDSQIQIRLFGQKDPMHKQFLHAKCYIFLGQGEADGIIGSSNFTEKGLEDNAELNYLETENSIVAAPFNQYSNSKSYNVWFEEKWEQSEPWNGKFLQILSAAPVGQPKAEPEQPEEDLTAPLTPYELYIKLLQIRFGNIVDKTLGEQIVQYLPDTYDSYDYQIDAVKQCFSIMKEHGGFMLADVVGLGKTIVGTLLVKHFLQVPDDEGREQKVLIVTPPAIQSAWKRTIAEFDEQSELKISPFVDYITTGSVGKLVDIEEDDGEADLDLDTDTFEGDLQQVNYGLIIVDESHKFRTRTTSMYQALDTLIANIGADTGIYPYVGLLSATPQNNRPSDLQNQIYLFERNVHESTLKKAKGGNLEGFFAEANREYANIMHPKDEDGNPIELPIEESNRLLKELSLKIRNCVLSDIMIRRTRTDVQKYYQKDMTLQNMHFPRINGPIELPYKMSPTLAKLFHDSMMSIAPEAGEEGLMYYRYRAIQYLSDPEVKKKYDARGSRNADKLAEQLANIMQMNLVKRLESSFTAFVQSLLNLKQYTQNMIDMWERDCIFICPEIDINDELDRKKIREKLAKKQKVEVSQVPMPTIESCFENIRKHIAKLNAEGRNDNGANMEYHRPDFDESYITLLRHDYEIINDLCDRWAHNSEDPKFDVFKENLRSTLFNPETNIPQKLVIFTEAIDTADSVAAAAEAKNYRVLKITAANRDDKEQEIRENFDAKYKGEWKNDYDIIVTTDVLAEGINLHRANCILNYDTPWNSTRLMNESAA